MSSEPLIVTNPYSDAVVAELPRHDDGRLDAVLGRAVTAQADWARRPLAERIERVAAGLERFRDRGDDVVRDVTLQMGKPLSQSRNELGGFFQRAEHMLAIAEEALAPHVLPPADGLVRRMEHTPLGVVLALAAWNYPLLIPVNVLVPALLAGNAVVLKHSALTPLCGQHIVEALGEELPDGLLSHVVVDHDQVSRLVGDARVAHVAFTGSVAGGHAVQRAAAERFIHCGLELGGKDPAYVAADADLDTAVPGLVDGACYNAGQSCCAVERVYVHASRYDEFLERARPLLEAYVPGDPMADATTLGPMARRNAPADLAGQVADAIARGARLLCGGAPVNERFFAPTLLAACPLDCDAMQAESFGPLLPVRAVADDAEALAAMNDSRYGLTASVWTTDLERAEAMAAELDTGTVFCNRCDVLDPGLAWTGVKDTGKGATLSVFGFHHLTRLKSLNFRPHPG
jgi:acyl-CoA reductase-like NAD-dependent aldehyde dehydrogenase